jgi:hypothetical protein
MTDEIDPTDALILQQVSELSNVDGMSVGDVPTDQLIAYVQGLVPASVLAQATNNDANAIMLMRATLGLPTGPAEPNS